MKDKGVGGTLSGFGHSPHKNVVILDLILVDEACWQWARPDTRPRQYSGGTGPVRTVRP